MMRFLGHFAVLGAFLGALLLAGCVFDGDPELVMPKLPQHFVFAQGRAERDAPSFAPADGQERHDDSEADYAKFADAFGDPVLQALERRVLAQNFDIADAYAKIQQADAQATVAGAPLFPALSATGNASHDVTSGQTRGTSGTASAFSTGFDNSAIGHANMLSYGLSASYMVDFWGENRANLEAARQSATAARFARDVVALTALSGAANAYFTILATRARIALVEKNIARATAILDAIKARQAVGTATAVDVAQQDTLVANQLASLPPLKITLRQTQTALALLLGITPEELVGIQNLRGDVFSLHLYSIRAGLPGALLARRPDVAQAEATLAGDEALIAAARAAYLPNITLNASDGHESSILKTLFNPQAAFSNTAVALSQPVFSGFQLEGTLTLQQAKYRDAIALYQKAVVQALVDVDNALASVHANADYEAAERRAVKAASVALAGVERRLREGTVDITTLLTTQQNLFGAQDALVSARLARLEALVFLAQALGGGWRREDYDDAGKPTVEPAPPSGAGG